MRRGVSFDYKEGIDPAALTDQGDVGVDAFADRFEKGEIRGAGQVPVFRVAHNKIENVLAWRELDHGRVTDAGGDVDDLIGRIVYLQDGRAGRGVGRAGGRVLRQGERRDEADHRDTGDDSADGHRFSLLFSATGGEVGERPLEAVLFDGLGAAGTVARR